MFWAVVAVDENCDDDIAPDDDDNDVIANDDDNDNDDDDDDVWEGVMMSRPLFTLSYAGDPTSRQKLNGYW